MIHHLGSRKLNLNEIMMRFSHTTLRAKRLKKASKHQHMLWGVRSDGKQNEFKG